MKIPLLLCLILATIACNYKPQPVIANISTDTIIPAADTAFNPYTDADRIKDSLQFIHKRDSFLAIKPLAILTSKKEDLIDKLIATVIDTNGVTRIPLSFSDTTITKYDKDDMPVSRRQILKNNRFFIEVFYREDDVYKPGKLFINGRPFRAGIEIDTSVSGSFYADNIEIDGEDCAILKFGAKEYLLLSGGMSNCNGSACGVKYYLLYDPVIRKAMLLQQFRGIFITGYDKKTNSPVFIDMYVSLEKEPYFNVFKFAGKVYRFDHTGKIKRMMDASGKQHYFSGYSTYYYDSLIVVNGNWPGLR